MRRRRSALDRATRPVPARLTDRLVHWAEAAPDRMLHRAPRAQRRRQHRRLAADHLRARRWTRARRVGQALLDRGLRPERPVAILCENSLEHAMLALGCLYAGVPYCRCRRPTRRVSQDYDKLRHVLGTLTPGPGVRHRRRALRQGHRRRPCRPTSKWCWPQASSKAARRRRCADLLRHARRRRAVDRAMQRHRPGHHHQVPVHLGLDQAAQGA